MFTKPKLPTDYGFGIWFNKKEKSEYYVAPLYFYKIKKARSVYNNKPTVKLMETVPSTKINCHTTTYFKPYVERYGAFFINFLNADFSSHITAYETFFAFYGIELLKEYIIDETDFTKSYASEKKFLEAFDALFSKCQEQIIALQELFRNCVNYTYNLKENNEDSEYTALERFTSFVLRKDLYAYSINTKIYFDNLIGYDRDLSRLANNKPSEIRKKMKNNKICMKTSHILHSTFLSNIVFFSLYEIATNEHTVIKNCENCGKYFIPTTKQTEIYCDITYYEIERSCRDVGAGKRYKKNIDEVEGYIIYRRTYQKSLMQIKRNPSISGEFKANYHNWKQQAQNKIKEFKKGLLTEEEFNLWMRKNKDF